MPHITYFFEKLGKNNNVNHSLPRKRVKFEKNQSSASRDVEFTDYEREVEIQDQNEKVANLDEELEKLKNQFQSLCQIKSNLLEEERILNLHIEELILIQDYYKDIKKLIDQIINYKDKVFSNDTNTTQEIIEIKKLISINQENKEKFLLRPTVDIKLKEMIIQHQDEIPIPDMAIEIYQQIQLEKDKIEKLKQKAIEEEMKKREELDQLIIKIFTSTPFQLFEIPNGHTIGNQEITKINSIFKKYSRMVHPDKNRDEDPIFCSVFQRLNELKVQILKYSSN